MQRPDVLPKATIISITWFALFCLLLAVAPLAGAQAPVQLPADALVVASPADASILYAATGDVLYRSADAGQTWAEVASLPGTASVLLPANHSVELLYAGTLYDGIYRSIDGGESWQALNDGLGLLPGTMLDVSALALDPADDGLLYAATGYWLGSTELHFSPAELLVSPDGGANWLPLARLPLNGDRVESLAPVAGQRLAVQANGQVYRADVIALAGLMASPNATPARQAAASQALGLLGNQAAVPALLAELDSGNALLAARAAEALGNLRAEEAIPALGKLLLAENTATPSAAAHALAAIGTPEALDILYAALASDEMTPARHAAMGALENLGSPAVPGLLELAAAANPVAQRNAVEMLGWIADPAAQDGLLAALQAPDAQVRAQAAWALGELADPAAYSALAVAAEADASPDVRLQATQAMARLPEPAPETVVAPEVVAVEAAPLTTEANSPLAAPLHLLPILRWVVLALVLGLAALLPWYQSVREQRRRRPN